MSSVASTQDAGPALRVGALDAWYGRAQALFAVSLALAPGEVLAMVGRNGAGKSTTLAALMGLVRAQGAVELAGQSLAGLPTHQRARLGLGYVPQERRIFTDLTVQQNLTVGAQGRPYDLDGLLELFPNLADLLDRPAAQMSGGEQQMLAVARTLAAGPRVVLLDEPSEGIAPLVVARLALAVQALKAQGVAVLLSEQNARFVAQTADRALLIERGEVVGEAAPRDLLHPTAAVRSVLGL
ncbi:MAG: ABC transporter ATP-binding protein [Burkholderiales bacterium]|nr:ABC transporter ATP-binding protein [Burkholderiales bacterium]